MIHLRAAEVVLAVEPALFARAAPRLAADPFLAEAAPTSAGGVLEVRVVADPAGGEQVRLPHATMRVARRGSVLEVTPTDDLFVAEAQLKLAFCAAVLDRGGLLVHASAAAFDGGPAIVAVGPSGAGKSTLARWCQRAGAGLLSDECVGLFPQGTVAGTPFCSDPDLGATLRSARVGVLVQLAHGPSARFEPLPAPAALGLLLRQTYRPVEGWLGRAELLARATRIATGSAFERFTLPDAPEAGAAARARLCR